MFRVCRDRASRVRGLTQSGWMAEAVDVIVDVDTGHLRVESVVCAVDVGKAINPGLVKGQIEGAVAQAHGYAVTEQLLAKEGRIFNPNLSTYLMPGIGDIPGRVESVILEIPDPRGPWGVRGMAEMPFIPLAPGCVGGPICCRGCLGRRVAPHSRANLRRIDIQVKRPPAIGVIVEKWSAGERHPGNGLMRQWQPRCSPN